MIRRREFLKSAGAGVTMGMVGASALRAQSSSAVRFTEMLSGLDQPWAIGFLPDGSYLVTERDGALLLVREGAARQVDGVPDVVARGQGGLLDVLVPRDFAETREILLSHAQRTRGGSNTAITAARLSPSGDRLTNARRIFTAGPGYSGGRDYGGRLVEARDGTIFLTTGDRGTRPSSQDQTSHNGAVIRVARDGSVPGDNPFVGAADVRPEIWTYGHRNPQGAALDLRGNLWTVEHGARGGDEINEIIAGRNYGWPVISYGRHYSGASIGEGTARPDMEQPAFYWDPSMAPSGMMIYSGTLWPEWRGHVFVGSLKFNYLSRLSGSPLRETEQIRTDETLRVRDVREAPDGSIWILSVGNGAIYRMTPATS